jgi:F420-non-reducing hydrogenase iron-sulfur subunit
MAKKKTKKPTPKRKTSPTKTRKRVVKKKVRKVPSKKKVAKKKDSRKGKEWLPRIVTFACNWCSYAGADLAGVSRLQYPPTQRIIRVMCSGRINPTFVLDAFMNGADGVIVSGCHFEDCHYISGSRKAEKMIDTTKRLMRLLGIDERRLRFELISAAEGQKFAAVAREFTAEIQTLEKGKNGKE